MDVIDGFMHFLLEQENDANMVPIFQYGDVTFIYTRSIDVFCELINKLSLNNVCVTCCLLYLLRH